MNFALQARRRAVAVRGSVRGFVLAIVAIAQTGLGAVPDAGPLVKSAVDVRAAVVAAGSAVESELRRLPDGDPHAERFALNCKRRVEASDADVEFASSIHSMVQASADTCARVPWEHGPA